jgi:hypothetical protein
MANFLAWVRQGQKAARWMGTHRRGKNEDGRQMVRIEMGEASVFSADTVSPSNCSTSRRKSPRARDGIKEDGADLSQLSLFSEWRVRIVVENWGVELLIIILCPIHDDQKDSDSGSRLQLAGCYSLCMLRSRTVVQ